MKRTNRENIRRIFMEKTGAVLPRSRPALRWGRRALLAAAAVCLLTVTALAAREFTSLEGDELALSAEYLGGGAVQVTVENRSDKTLRLEPRVKLSQWVTGEELTAENKIAFAGAVIPAGETRTLTLDLSAACDAAQLENPLEGDWYYLTFTNRGFLLGQDWTCAIPSRLEAEAAALEDELRAQEEALRASSLHAAQEAEESLRFYFEEFPGWATPEEARLRQRYAQAAREYVDGFDGDVARPVSPGMFVFHDTEQSAAEQAEAWGAAVTALDGDHRLLAMEGDEGWCLYAFVPDSVYPDALVQVPLLYVFIYEADAARPGSYAFLHGRLVDFALLEEKRIYADETYAAYDVSEYIYEDIRAAAESSMARNPHASQSPEVTQRLWEEYAYLKEALPRLIMYYDDYRALSEG